MTTPVAPMQPGNDHSKTSDPGASTTPGSAHKRKGKNPATPTTVRNETQEPAGTPSQANSNKRKKPRNRANADGSLSGLALHDVDPSASAWKTIVAFRTSFGKAFDRVLDAGFTLASVRRMVAEKYRIPSHVAIHLAYVAPDGHHIDLDDSEDFRAFQVHAARESTITVHVDAPESSVGTAAAPTTSEGPAPMAEPESAPAQPTHAKARGRRGRGANRAEEVQEQEQGAGEDSASAMEVSQFFSADKPSEEAPATPAKRGRKRKADQQPVNQEVGDTTATATEPEPAEPAQEAPPAPEAHDAEATPVTEQAASTPAEGPGAEEPSSSDDEDVPLSSQTAPPSSQPPPSSQTDSPEKPKRSRRTKAEMEVFRAEKAAKKAAKEQERAQKQAAKSGGADVSTARDGDVSGAQDETVIVHEARNEEHTAAASAAVQALVEVGIDAMQQRLSELKAKKQRKNAVEREEQKMLVNMVKGMNVTPSEADVSSRELPPNAQRAKADAQLTSHESDLAHAPVPANTAARPDAEDSESSDESRDYFSQPESHANLSGAQVQGPSPRPESPMESTPQRGRRAADASEASSRRTMSGAFTKLSDLRPSALRRSFSQQEQQKSGAQPESRPAAGAEAPQAPEEDDSDESDSSDDSSDDEAPPASQASALPASKRAGASAEASAADASKAKKKRSFFSVLS